MNKINFIFIFMFTLIGLYTLSYIYFRKKYEYDGGLSKGGEVSINGNFSKVIKYTGFPHQSKLEKLYYPLILIDKPIFGRHTLIIDNQGHIQSKN